MSACKLDVAPFAIHYGNQDGETVERGFTTLDAARDEAHAVATFRTAEGFRVDRVHISARDAGGMWFPHGTVVPLD